MNCKTCGGAMIQKRRARLFIVGVLILASVALGFFTRSFWMLGVVLGLAGGYLLVWATLGRGFCAGIEKSSASSDAEMRARRHGPWREIQPHNKTS
jgi:hypothetical protein